MSDALFDKALISLDWPRLLERLTSYAGSALGQERIQDIEFLSAPEAIQRRIEETSELRTLLDQGVHIPVGGIRDIRAVLTAADKGEALIGRELLEVAETLRAAQQLKRFFHDRADTCPRTQAHATRLHDLQELSGLLEASFDASGELSASMYPELARMRSRIYALHSRIKDRLGELLTGGDLAAMAQDQYVTVRGERYVVPLKVQARSMDLGIVHDTSGSGQTVFVEPRQIIPLNNELKMLEAELKRETRRILAELSRRVMLEEARIHENLSRCAELEFIYARANLSRDLDSVAPVLVKQPRLVLRRARHPVLVLRGIQVVPNDLSIGSDFQALILSGPNTGGKTVALKTLGLCALMTRAGLHIPADPGSEVGIFTRVFTDIGDQQTVEHDLSTFSGHIVGMRRILETIGNYGYSSLVLLDEIAVGTDPTQGAALARALLEAFVERGAKVVVTTHYAELKTLSVQDRRFANGRVEYDSVGLAPTYRVVIGTPGRSYALDIALKLGLPGALVERARGYLASGQRALEDLLGELEQATSAARDERILTERARREAEALRDRFEARLKEVDAEAARLNQKAMSRFEDEVRKARDEISGVVRAMQEAKGVKLITAQEARDKVSDVVRRVRVVAPRAQTDPLHHSIPVPTERLKPGFRALVSSLKKEGEVVSVAPEGGLVEVQVGNLRIKVWPDDLRMPAPPQAPNRGQKGTTKSPKTAPARVAAPRDPMLEGETAASAEGLEHAFQTSYNTLDLRGKRVDEGLDLVERFLDKASLAGEPYVFVIHGHGTGAMKSAVREWLKASPYVQRFQAAERHQGGDGATVVALV